MSTAAMHRDALLPGRPVGMGRGLAFALVAHMLLIVILTMGVNWHSSEPEGVEAELWSATPQIAAPRAVETPPPPPPPPPAPVQPRVVAPPPRPAPQPTVDPQIAIEQAKREREQKKQEDLQARKDLEKRQKLLDAQAVEDAKKLAAKKKQAEQLADQKQQELDAKKQSQVEDRKRAAIREANLKRMMGQADATGDASATGNAQRTSGPSASYAGRIMARIRPNMYFPDTLDGNPGVEVTITLAPDGTITSKRVTKPSSAPEFDNAVLRALEKTAILPRDETGRVFSPMTIVYNLRDLKP